MPGEDLYANLGVSRGSSPQEIKKAYREKAKECHPDKGGNEEEFKKIERAYSVLSDDGKRNFYDQTGQIESEGGGGGGGGGFGGGGFGGGGFPGGFPFPFGMGGGGGGGGVHVNMGDFFGGMFGGGQGQGQGGQQKQVRRPKGPNKQHEIFLRLPDFYFGKSVRFDLERQIFCTVCKGAGCVSWNNCNQCGGAGVQDQHIQIAPGMIAINRVQCGLCKGEGRSRGANCSMCEARGLIPQTKTLEVKIRAGAAVGETLVFDEVCSDHADFEKPGDVHIRLMPFEEELDLVREGKALRHVTSVCLTESLMGCKRKVKSHPAHLEGLEVDIPAGTQNGEVLCLKGLGMPSGAPSEFGDLFVRVEVKVSDVERKTLETHKVLLQGIFGTVAA